MEDRRRELTKLRVRKHRRVQKDLIKWQSLVHQGTSDSVREPSKYKKVLLNFLFPRQENGSISCLKKSIKNNSFLPSGKNEFLFSLGQKYWVSRSFKLR